MEGINDILVSPSWELKETIQHDVIDSLMDVDAPFLESDRQPVSVRHLVLQRMDCAQVDVSALISEVLILGVLVSVDLNTTLNQPALIDDSTAPIIPPVEDVLGLFIERVVANIGV